MELMERGAQLSLRLPAPPRMRLMAGEAHHLDRVLTISGFLDDTERHEIIALLNEAETSGKGGLRAFCIEAGPPDTAFARAGRGKRLQLAYESEAAAETARTWWLQRRVLHLDRCVPFSVQSHRQFISQLSCQAIFTDQLGMMPAFPPASVLIHSSLPSSKRGS